ncbi:MAG: PadR family transcriptional regulator [Armatimonadetes bacterium]|nr:PadR family transcriptional regulator [Armatimonadota bacterium]
MAIFSGKEEGGAKYGAPAMLVLISLAEGEKHGYAVMQDIVGNMGVPIGPGTLYVAIGRLVRSGLVEALPSEERTRPYRITEAGRQEVERFLSTWSSIVRLGKERMA